MKTIEDIKQEIILLPEYEFLVTNPTLNEHIMFLGLGGSLAYGTSTPNSDTDIRGVFSNSLNDLFLGKDNEQVVDTVTDTVLYSLQKIFNLLSQCNPNTIEILGLSDDQVIQTSPAWEMVRQNKDLFLSKRAVQTFGGYANSQLRRLETKKARETGQAQKEKYILGSIESAQDVFRQNYAKMDSDSMKLFIGPSEREGFETEIKCDIHLTGYPLRDLTGMMNEYHSIVRDYDKLGKRNEKAIAHEKLGKHAMHLVRLYYMAFDILEKGEINTYRAKEHDLLMSIRNGEYFESDGITPKKSFYDMVDKLDARLKQDKETTLLPDEPDMKKIHHLLQQVQQEFLQNEFPSRQEEWEYER